MATQPDDDLYSDDSATSVSAEQSQSLSPTDGYFQPSVGARLSQPQATQESTSASQTACHAVPHIPDVMVQDPTLSDLGRSKATEALQGARQPGCIPQGLPTGHLLSSRPQENDHANVTQTTFSDRADGLDYSNSVSNANAAQGLLPPTTPIRDGVVGPRLPVQPVDAPPAYTSARLVNYGTMEASSHDRPLRTSDEATLSAGSDSEPLLTSQAASRNNTLDAGFAGSANEYLPSNKRLQFKLCLLLFITAAFSSLVTAGIILLPTAPKNESVDEEPISIPEDEQPLTWDPPVGLKCRNTPYTVNGASYPVSLGPESALNIVEDDWNSDVVAADSKAIKTFGDIVVLNSPLVVSPQVSLDGISNDPRIRPRMDISSGRLTHTYRLTGPAPISDWPNEDSLPCYQVRITLWLPMGATYRSTAFASENLNVLFRVGLNVSVTDQFVAMSNAGNIVAPHLVDVDQGGTAPYRLQSPDLLMASGLGTVQGWFPLYNTLSLISTHGDISTQIGLKSLAMLQDTSAELVATSRWGNINLTAVPPQRDRFGKRDGKIPERDYVSIVQTRMGNIMAQLPIGSRTEFETVSGRTQVDLQPILGFQTQHTSRNPMLVTLSETGDCEILVQEPIWTDAIKRPRNGDLAPGMVGYNTLTEAITFESLKDYHAALPITKKPNLSVFSLFSPQREHSNSQAAVYREAWGDFDTRHISSGGDLLITYPDSWSGRINWQGLNSERLNILGSGVTVLRQWGSSIKHIEAQRGTGLSVVNIEQQRGSVTLAIGETLTQIDTE